MTRDEIVELYSTRLEERRAERERRGTKVSWVSYARLAVFVAGVAMAWFVWETDSLPWPWLSAPLAAFAAPGERISQEATQRSVSRRGPLGGEISCETPIDPSPQGRGLALFVNTALSRLDLGGLTSPP